MSDGDASAKDAVMSNQSHASNGNADVLETGQSILS